MARMRLLVVAMTVALSAVPALPAHARAKPTLKTFAGDWIGHTRYMKISGANAKEHIGDGCCHPIFNAHYKLSNPRNSPKGAIVTATVTYVKVFDADVFTDAFPRPRVGQKTTFRLRKDVLVELSRKVTYCGPSKSVCGA